LPSGAKQESTMIQSPQPRCATTHSPNPVPKRETSSSSGSGGSVGAVQVKEGQEGFSLFLRSLHVTWRPRRQSLKADDGRARELPMSFAPVTDDPIKNRTWFYQLTVARRDFSYRNLSLFLRSGTRLINHTCHK